jgi:hypothetical protein
LQKAEDAAATQDARLDINARRRAAHGAGTTLIAIQAAANLDPIVEAELAGFMQALDALGLEAAASERVQAACPSAAQVKHPSLRAACLLLERAADLRSQRGEGAIGRIYTRENIGFLHLLNEDWETAEKHALEIDNQLTAAWNLTVLIIAMDMRAAALDEAEEERQAREVRAETEPFIRKMSLLDVDDLDEAEIMKLLEARHLDRVKELKSQMKGAPPAP